MSMIHVAPEAHLVLDPLTSLLAAEREDIISYSMDPIMVQLDELDKIADDLVNSFRPTSHCSAHLQDVKTLPCRQVSMATPSTGS